MTLRNIALAGTLGRGAAELAGLAEAPEIGRHDRRHPCDSSACRARFRP
jgi:hypothetical protein